MKYLDDEEKEKLHELGTKILQAKKLTKEITEFFVEQSDSGELHHVNYYGTEELLDAIDLFIDGKSPDYIGDQIFQDDGEYVIKILHLLGIEPDGDQIIDERKPKRVLIEYDNGDKEFIEGDDVEKWQKATDQAIILDFNHGGHAQTLLKDIIWKNVKE